MNLGQIFMIHFFKKIIDFSNKTSEQEEESRQTQSSVGQNEVVLRKMADLIIEHCASNNEKPSFSITEKTNFKRDLNFDKSDMGIIISRLQVIFHVEFPKGSTFFNRPANDTDYTVGELLAAYGLFGLKSEGQHEKLSDNDKEESIYADYLPSFTDMDEDASIEEIVRVAGLTSTILNLTFRNPFPIEQDPVFKSVLKKWTTSLMEVLNSGEYSIDPHVSLKEAYSAKYPDGIVQSMMELDYWNQRMIEHVVLTKTFGPKPAYKCLEKALALTSFAAEASAILIINYAYLLLKCSVLKWQNPIAVEDIIYVLKKASAFLHFEAGVRAQNDLGVCYENGHDDYEKAADLYQKAAVQGEARAQNNLGDYYYYGNGVSQSYEKAVEWYQKAAAQGYAIAQNNLGDCYEYGEGVPKDLRKAVEWWQKAAEQGYASAQYNLGVCYSHGIGVSEDYGKAVEWYQKAAEQGNADAQYNLGCCYKDGEGVPKDLRKAVEWYQKAAAQGYASAQNNLGDCYYHGNGVSQSYEKAVEWWQKAAAQGDASAQCNLGYCYEYGKGVSKDYGKAVEWYQKAAEQEDAVAQYNLGYCYEEGYSVPKDYGKAVEWYQKAAEQEDADAQYNLGVCYKNGYGAPQNKEKAIELFRKAAAQGQKDAEKELEIM